MDLQLYWPWHRQNSDVDTELQIFLSMSCCWSVFHLIPKSHIVSPSRRELMFYEWLIRHVSVYCIKQWSWLNEMCVCVWVWQIALRMWRANKGIAKTRFAVYECSSVKRSVIWHKVSEKGLTLGLAVKQFSHTNARSHMHTVRWRSVSREHNGRRDNTQRYRRGGRHLCLTHGVFFPLWMTGYIN